MANHLIEAAWEARKRAHAIYSNFLVGAAVETSNGNVFKGCNVENASYSLTICAERTALFSAITAGEKEFKRLVVASENGVSPCGACRQVIWEICGDIPITLVDKNGNCKETSSAKLLPQAFGQDDLV